MTCNCKQLDPVLIHMLDEMFKRRTAGIPSYHPTREEWDSITRFASPPRLGGYAVYHGVLVRLDGLTQDEYDRVIDSEHTVYPVYGGRTPSFRGTTT